MEHNFIPKPSKKNRLWILIPASELASQQVLASNTMGKLTSSSKSHSSSNQKEFHITNSEIYYYSPDDSSFVVRLQYPDCQVSFSARPISEGTSRKLFSFRFEKSQKRTELFTSDQEIAEKWKQLINSYTIQSNYEEKY